MNARASDPILKGEDTSMADQHAPDLVVATFPRAADFVPYRAPPVGRRAIRKAIDPADRLLLTGKQIGDSQRRFLPVLLIPLALAFLITMASLFLASAPMATVAASIGAFVASVAVGAVIVATKGWHGHFTLDGTVGIQKFHETPTPRIGGVSIILGLTVAWYILAQRWWPSAIGDQAIIGPMLLASIPACAFGLMEDVTKRVGVLSRLLATVTSGAIVCLATHTSVRSVGVPGFDYLLGWPVLSIIFTAFAVGGVANAVNIIDGFNGLAAGTLIISLTAIKLIAQRVGDVGLADSCLYMQAAILGLTLLNFPFGKIFLGDGGAYAAGFYLAWLVVLLPIRNPSVSPWTSLAIVGYPVLEVLFSVWRKYRREGHRPGAPDKVHLHMLVYNRVVNRIFPQASPRVRNSLTSLFLWGFAAIPTTLAVLTYSHPALLMGGMAFTALCYHMLYVRLTQFKWRLTIR